jgi:predicted TIM-barrel fold metal-dependent hydrolase
MNRRDFLKNSAGCTALIGISPALAGCSKDYYSAADFVEAPKVDAHVHYNTLDDSFLMYAQSLGMHIISVNTDAGESFDIDEQLDVAVALRKQHPGMIDFLGTFPVDSFGKDGFSDLIIARIDQCMNAGAKGIKIWKNIGMDLLDAQGNYVMADHPAFAPVFSYIEKQQIPLLAHLGEPKNCWLPYDQMTIQSDLNYYREHPEYHMFQFPEKPSYEDQIVARDRLLERYPKIAFTGAHIGSLEWSIDEVAKRFEAHPNFSVDLAERVWYLQLQSFYNREKVQSFLTTYQDRILYGSDIICLDTNSDKRDELQKNMKDIWLTQWRFFATDDVLPSNQFTFESAPKEMKGLRLPKTIVDKIFHGNTKRIFGF